MAYVYKPEDEEQLKKGAQPTSGVVGAVTNPGAPTGAPAANTAAPVAAGTGFVNLQRYLDANQGAGQKLASETTAGVNKDVDTLKTDATTAVGTAQTELGAAAGGAEADRLKTGLTSGNVTGVVSDAQKFLGSAYTGKAADTYTGGLVAGAEKLNPILSTIGTVPTQQNLLEKTYSSPNKAYDKRSFGSLDSFLMGADAGGRDTLAKTGARQSEVASAVKGAQTTIGQAATDSAKQFETNKGNVLGAAKGRYGSIVKDAEARMLGVESAQRADVDKQLDGVFDAFRSDPRAAGAQAPGVKDQFVAKNANFGVDDVYTDADVEALNALATLDPSMGAVQKGSDRAYTGDGDAWKRFIESAIASAPPPPPAPAPPVSNNVPGALQSVADAGKVVEKVVKAPENAAKETKKVVGKAVDGGVRVAETTTKTAKTPGGVKTDARIPNPFVDPIKKLLSGGRK